MREGGPNPLCLLAAAALLRAKLLGVSANARKERRRELSLQPFPLSKSFGGVICQLVFRRAEGDRGPRPG